MKDRLLTSTGVLRSNPFYPVYNPAGRSAGGKQTMVTAEFFFTRALQDPVR
jgi:hypothetical protein